MLSDLFKSKKQREDESKERQARNNDSKKRERRVALMQAQVALGKLCETCQNLERNNEKVWTKAREYKRVGRDTAARMELSQYSANCKLLELYSKKHFVMTNFLTRLQVVETDEMFNSALSDLAKLLNCDSVEMMREIDSVKEVLDKQDETDSIWNQEFASITSKADWATTTLPSVDQLMKELDKEASMEIAARSNVEATPSTNSEIASARERMSRIIDEKGA